MFKYLSVFLLGLGVTGFTAQALAAPVTIPNSFSAGTPAVAAEVNDNFAAVKSAVDDNDSRLQAMETGSVSFSLTGLLDSRDDDASCRLGRTNSYAFYQTGAGVGCAAFMPVSLPHGRTLLAMRCTVFDNDGSVNNVDGATLIRTNLSSGATNVIFSISGSVNSASLQQLLDLSPAPGTAVIDNASYVYQLWVGLDESNSVNPADIRAYGCVISYQ